MGTQIGTVASLMSSCPHIDVLMGGVTVAWCCLAHAWWTLGPWCPVTESFFLEQFAPRGSDLLLSCHWLQLREANGLAIPYVGYLELDVELCGKLIPRCGILVVKDPLMAYPPFQGF